MSIVSQATGAVIGTYRIGIDVGGTFTDFSVVRMTDGAILNHKEPSTPVDPSLAVQRGLSFVMDRYKLAPDDFELIVHSTTIGLNAILQRQGARLALVVSKGNRDILEIGRSRVARPYAIFGCKEQPLVPRSDVLACSARAGTDGSTVSFPDNNELDNLAVLLREREVEAVAITLLNAYVAPDLELRLKQELSRRLPDLPITTSTEVWPEMREYERCLVAGLNASIYPLMTLYYNQLQVRLTELGVRCNIFITGSNGGTLSMKSAIERPIDTVLSGPASGVVAASNLAREHNLERVLTVDIGGTSSDMAVCTPRRPEVTTHTWLGECPLITPTVSVTAIGAGGGSLVRVDSHGLLKVGPESAGADPGPVCYSRGGTQPTVTDCYLALGLLRPDGFAGGRMLLDREAALAALDEVGAQLGFADPERMLKAAAAALRVATANMAAEMLKDLARRGIDPKEVALLAFGGAGPTHAAMLAEEVQVYRVVVPLAPGLFSALGALAADARRDFIRTIRRCLDNQSAEAVVRHIAELTDEAQEWLTSEGPLIRSRIFLASLDMRYVGQAYEINVELEADSEINSSNLSLSFHEAHARLHGFADPESRIELQSVRVQAIGSMARTKLASWHPSEEPNFGKRRVWQNDMWTEFQVLQRQALSSGDVLQGPTLVEQPDTTIFIPLDWSAVVQIDGTLIMEKKR